MKTMCWTSFSKPARTARATARILMLPPAHLWTFPASNFERFVFDLMDRDPQEINTLWTEVAAGKGFDLQFALDKVGGKYGFTSSKSTHADRLATIKQVYEQDQELIDPHTADGVKSPAKCAKKGKRWFVWKPRWQRNSMRPYAKPSAMPPFRALPRWKVWKPCRSACKPCRTVRMR